MTLRYLISARDEGVNPRRLAPALLSGYREGLAEGNPRFDDWAENSLPRLIDGKRVLVMCHGYNVKDPLKAIVAYRIASAPIQDHYDVILELLWPGSDSKLGFWAARSRAQGTAELLDQALRVCRPAYVDFNGHSLAAEVYRHLTGRHWRLAILAGAAVPHTTENRSAFTHHRAYYSKGDGVLAA